MKAKVLLVLISILSAMPFSYGVEYYGYCGENLEWTFQSGTLTITGSGEMDDYGVKTQPWLEFRDDITQIILPEGLTSITANAFLYCKNVLTEVIIPESVERIEAGSFCNCRIPKVRIPRNVKSISAGAFPESPSLAEFTVDANNPYYSSQNGVLFNKNRTTLITYPRAKTGTSYTIPNGVTCIGQNAFAYNSKLSTVTIPNTVTVIERNAMYGNNFTSITIPNSVTTIGDEAFYEDKKLTTVSIGSGVVQIGKAAFGDCPLLSTVTINSSNSSFVCNSGIIFSKDGKKIIQYLAGRSGTTYTVGSGITEIAEGAFAWATKLTAINVNSGNANYCSVDGVLFDKNKTILLQYPLAKTDTAYTVPDGVEILSYAAFSKANNLHHLHLPASLKRVGNRCAFIGNLSSLIIPEGVTSMDHSGFRTQKLLSVAIPSSLSTIGGLNFAGFVGTKSVYCNAMIPLTFPSSSLREVDKSSCVLYVPEGTENLYRAADVWKLFRNIEPIAETNPACVNTSGMLPGTFSTSATTKVVFSQGNLQYNALAGTHQCADNKQREGLWRFASHQYDYIAADNLKADRYYDGWIDMFAWGTSGWNSGVNEYQPYTTGSTISDYLQTPLRDTKRFADWGVFNAIYNGGNLPENWRCLTIKEWDYIFYQRSNASSLFGAGRVDTINGLILLPDNWQTPDGLTFNPSIKKFTDNVYSKVEWARMEKSGAVFLPAEGYISVQTPIYKGSNTGAWYASSDTISYATGKFSPGMVRFTADSLNLYANHGFSTHYSVRLVREIDTYTITWLAEDGELIRLDQNVEYGSTLTPPTAPDKDGYTFVGWTNGYENISADAVIYATYKKNTSGEIPGALLGVFSISPTAKIVFSQGNLQYNAMAGQHRCADGTTHQGAWRFALHQWDIVGNATRGTVYSDGVKCNNAVAGASYAGWIDLFGWGTSGWNSGANAYLPYAISTTNSDYYPGNNETNHLTGDYAYADWGVYNAIINGGNEPGQWRTLTGAEWNYLNEERVDAASKKSRATVNNIAGCVFLPDEWTLPDGLSFTPLGGSFTANVYSAEEWAKMETNGAVFLPAAGYRDGTSVGDVIWGDYWLASAFDENDAFRFMFHSSVVSTTNSHEKRQYGFGLRLIKDLPSYTIIWLKDNGDTIRVDKDVEYGTTLTPPIVQDKEGYTFSGWTEGYQHITSDATIYASYCKNATIDLPGALPGVFSIGTTTKVVFSQGNLQYNAMAGTHTAADKTQQKGAWRFAEHQWDYVGKDNKNLSATYDKWCDLFCWGTSGWLGSGGIEIQPYSNSLQEDSYFQGSLKNADQYADWGVYNAIINGGNIPQRWRCMSAKEYEYLLTGRPNAAALASLACVNSVNGLMILPDNWVTPTGIAYSPTLSSYSQNTYTQEQWAILEENGAVFLPAAGWFYWKFNSFREAQTAGWYVSSDTTTIDNKKLPNIFGFSADEGLFMKNSNHTYATGHSIRLVASIPSFEVIWQDEDGTELKIEMVEYGSLPVAPANPSKPSDAEYTYTFAGWTPSVSAVTGDQIYTATYTATKQEYTITWKQDDGTTIDQTLEEYGQTPTHADPTKPATAEYTYSFAGWSPAITSVTGDATYTATYNATKNSYTITWKNDDGSTIDQTVVEYGQVPAHADPTKPADAEYTYTFSGWTPSVSAVTGDQIYTATYTATKQEYTITWKQDDGTTIDQTLVEYGQTPTHANPTKTGGEDFYYSFTGWTPAIAPISSDATYTASYIKVKSIKNVTIKAKNGKLRIIATFPTSSNVTLQADANASATFNGWSDGNTDIPRTITTVVGDTTTAAFDKLDYMITTPE